MWIDQSLDDECFDFASLSAGAPVSAGTPVSAGAWNDEDEPFGADERWPPGLAMPMILAVSALLWGGLWELCTRIL